MRRLSTMIRPMSMQWQDLGCSYNTSTGLRTVLKVRRMAVCLVVYVYDLPTWRKRWQRVCVSV
jgi:hypothetical protein